MKEIINKFFTGKQDVNESNETQNEFSIYFDPYSEIKKEWDAIREIDDDEVFLDKSKELETKNPKILNMKYFDFDEQVKVRTLKAMCKLLKK